MKSPQKDIILKNLYQIQQISKINKLSTQQYTFLYTPKLKGQYSNCYFNIKLIIPKDFPQNPPTIIFIDTPYHFNIHPKNGKLYAAFITDDWCPYINFQMIFEQTKNILDRCDEKYPADQNIKRQYEQNIIVYINKIKQSKRRLTGASSVNSKANRKNSQNQSQSNGRFIQESILIQESEIKKSKQNSINYQSRMNQPMSPLSPRLKRKFTSPVLFTQSVRQKKKQNKQGSNLQKLDNRKRQENNQQQQEQLKQQKKKKNPINKQKINPQPKIKNPQPPKQQAVTKKYIDPYSKQNKKEQNNPQIKQKSRASSNESAYNKIKSNNNSYTNQSMKIKSKNSIKQSIRQSKGDSQKQIRGNIKRSNQPSINQFYSCQIKQYQSRQKDTNKLSTNNHLYKSNKQLGKTTRNQTSSQQQKLLASKRSGQSKKSQFQKNFSAISVQTIDFKKQLQKTTKFPNNQAQRKSSNDSRKGSQSISNIQTSKLLQKSQLLPKKNTFSPQKDIKQIQSRSQKIKKKYDKVSFYIEAFMNQCFQINQKMNSIDNQKMKIILKRKLDKQYEMIDQLENLSSELKNNLISNLEEQIRFIL